MFTLKRVTHIPQNPTTYVFFSTNVFFFRILTEKNMSHINVELSISFTKDDRSEGYMDKNLLQNMKNEG